MTEEFDPKVYLQQGAVARRSPGGCIVRKSCSSAWAARKDRLRIVHVAGTNGKGSTCAFTAGILGKRRATRLACSPHRMCCALMSAFR